MSVIIVVSLASVPINFTIVISWTEVVLCDSAVSFKIFNMRIFLIKHRFDLVIPNIISPEIVNKDY